MGSGDYEVVLASMALNATTITALIYTLKWAIVRLSNDMESHTKGLAETAKTNREMLEFMRKLNGKLEKAVVDTAKEAKESKNA